MTHNPAIQAVIRQAHPAEAGLLSELAIRSKGYWQYDPLFLEACREELTITPGDIIARHFFVVEVEGRIAGFYALAANTSQEADLAFLFVEPVMIGQGLGRRLFQHAVATARRLGFKTMAVESDPNAEAFYRSMGALRTGEVPSGSIPGRLLPLMQVELHE